jgi:hypothetical protein
MNCIYNDPKGENLAFKHLRFVDVELILASR